MSEGERGKHAAEGFGTFLGVAFVVGLVVWLEGPPLLAAIKTAVHHQQLRAEHSLAGLVATVVLWIEVVMGTIGLLGALAVVVFVAVLIVRRVRRKPRSRDGVILCDIPDRRR